LRVKFQHFLNQNIQMIVFECLSDLTLSSKTPFAFFCTTTNVQDEKLCKCEKNYSEKVDKAIIKKNYNFSIQWQDGLH